MIKNIPTKISRTKLIELLDIHCGNENKRIDEQYLGLESCQEEMHKFDFVYLPINFRIGLNLGYAFVKFTRSVEVVRFFRCFQNFGWKSFDLRKVCEMKLARVQGKHEIVRRSENTYFRCDTDEFLAVMFSPGHWIARFHTQTQSSPFDFIENDESIPNKLSMTKLIELLDMHCDKENKKVDEKYSESCQDMSDFRTGLNLKNFTRSARAVLFFKCCHNFDWKRFDSNKGKQGLVMHFESSYFRCETDEYLPVKFSPAARDGSLSCAFLAGRLGQYGSSDATNILLGAFSQVKYVKSRTSLASLEVLSSVDVFGGSTGSGSGVASPPRFSEEFFLDSNFESLEPILKRL
ncbi:hypothetical protein GIB67_027297 [Kingdonia uniflora]|uniref:Mei2-like C-terminal RNA recognition motif domain-containing protein n=1 Tax=Kingdonia uniflora TaxID=39325 RepID=A0A7J7KYI8_9MAGN|nr:hypothetical protein GIB67_027297 [Kingdonia uniflora]